MRVNKVALSPMDCRGVEVVSLLYLTLKMRA